MMLEYPARVVVVILAATGWCQAALPVPRLNTVFPAGGLRGQTVEVVLEGTDLEGTTQLYFSRPGIVAQQVGDFKFNISIPNDAMLGPLDVRAVGKWGVSNPRTFCVGSFPETRETEPNNLLEQAQKIPIDTLINGMISARADVDYFSVLLEKDQSVVIDCQAKRIDSLLDAVVTLFGPDGRAIDLSNRYDGKDARLDFTAPRAGEYRIRVHDLVYNGASSHFYRLFIGRRPVVDYIFPPMVPAGQEVEVTAVGRNLPNGQKDDSTTIRGQAVELATLRVAAPPMEQVLTGQPAVYLEPRQTVADPMDVSIEGSDPISVGVTQSKIIVESEPNDDGSKALVIALPCEIAGRCERPHDADWYRFTATKGQVLEIEGLSEQSGFPVDLVVLLRRVTGTGADGKLTLEDVGEFDDSPQPSVGGLSYITSTHDPLVVTTLPADGDYLLEVRDRFGESRGDGRFVYRLRVASPEKDFRLFITPADPSNPSSLVIRPGGTLESHVYVIRRGGFNGEVHVSASELPPGISAGACVLGPGVNMVPLVLDAAPDAAEFTGTIKVSGTASIDGKDVNRAGRSSAIVWPAAGNAPRPSRLTRSICLAVRGTAPYRLAPSSNKFTIGQGAQIHVPLALERRWADFTDKLTGINAVSLPPQVETAAVEIPAAQKEGTVSLYFKPEVTAGTYTFVLKGTANIPFTKTPEDPKAQKAPVEVADPSLPVTVNVVPRPNEVLIDPASPQAKPGTTVNVKIKINRLNGYTGPVKVALTAPPGMGGIASSEVTIPPDLDQTTLPIQVAADVPVGDKGGLTVRGVAEMGPERVPVDALLVLKVAN